MAQRIPRVARTHAPEGTIIVQAERLSPAFVKYHLDNGQVLHRFTREEPHASPHDHPWSFQTTILTGGYVEEVFHLDPGGGWHSGRIHRAPGTVHRIEADHIHRIVELPAGECWTLVTPGSGRRKVRFWRFGDDVRSRAWNEHRFAKRSITP